MKIKHVNIDKTIVEGQELDLLDVDMRTDEQKHTQRLIERYYPSLTTLVEKDSSAAELDAGHHDLINVSDEMEEGYEQIAVLADAMRKKDFGVLIGKRGKLTYSDIREIKRELAKIIRSNPLIDGDAIKRGRDGKEKMRLMIRSLAHGVETVALMGIAAGLGGVAVGTSLTGVGAVAAGAGAAGAGALAINQVQTIRNLKELSKLLSIVDQYAELKPKVNTSRSGIRRVFDFIMGKSKKDIERRAEAKVKKATRKQRVKMEKMLKGFPKFIEYYDDGEMKEYPLVQLFDNL
jgi:hypothetical protein